MRYLVTLIVTSRKCRKNQDYHTSHTLFWGVEVALISAIPKLFEHYDVTCRVRQNRSENVAAFERPATGILSFLRLPAVGHPLAILKVQGFIIADEARGSDQLLWRGSMMGVTAKIRNPALKYISFIHSNTFFYRLDEFFSKKSLQNADCIFTDSEAFAEFIRSSHASRSEIKVISFFTRASPGHPTNASGD